MIYPWKKYNKFTIQARHESNVYVLKTELNALKERESNLFASSRDELKAYQEKNEKLRRQTETVTNEKDERKKVVNKLRKEQDQRLVALNETLEKN